VLVRRLRAKKSLEPRTSPGPAVKVKSKHRTWLSKALSKNPFLSSYELIRLFHKQFPSLQVHRSTILRVMHELGFSFKNRRLMPLQETDWMS